MPLSKSAQNTGAIISFFAIFLLISYFLFGTIGFGNETLLLSSLVIVTISLTTLCIIIMRKNRKAGKNSEIDYLNVGVQRYILALFMIMYGIDKLIGNFFDYQLFALDSKLYDISEFQLAWYYFGKNKWLELLSGILEFIPGLLLLHRRTYYTAALVLLFVTSQVFILNLFFKIGGVTFPAISILMACNIYIIYSEKEKINHFFKSLNFFPDLNLSNRAKKLVKVGRWTIYILAAFVIFVKIRPSFFKSAYYAKYKPLVGVYTLNKMTKNNVVYSPTNDSTLYKDLYIERQSRWNILRRFDNEAMAFILRIDPNNDSLKIYINRGGTGDGVDIIDTLTVLKGTYKLQGDKLSIKGIQLNDTLNMTYVKRDIKPKEWFW
jgi:hypothetical protein